MHGTRAATVATGCLLLPAGVSAAPVEPVPVGTRLELLADDHLLAGRTGLDFHPHRPEPREVALTADAPWEGNTSGYFGLFRDGDRFRMYYRGWQHTPDRRREAHPAVTCIAFSDDGIHWEKPELGLFPWEGSRANNIVFRGEAAHNFTVFKDGNPAAPPDARYKALGRERRGGRPALVAYQSPDGLRWRPMRDAPVITAGAFDSQNLAFWDPVRKEYRAYWRWFDRGVRAIRTARSQNFLDWEDQRDLAFAGDAPRQHLYTNAVLPYFRAPHLYLGFPTRYLPRDGQRVEPLFMCSRDGVRFTRYDEAVIPEDAPTDRKGNRSNYMAWGLLELPGRPGELSVYATEAYYGPAPGRIRRFAYRADRFVSLRAGPEEGACLTRPLVAGGPRLLLNYRLREGGRIAVEVRDASGRPLPGCRLAEARPLADPDALAGTARWRDGSAIALPPDRVVSLRIVMHRADLFAFRFATAP